LLERNEGAAGRESTQQTALELSPNARIALNVSGDHETKVRFRVGSNQYFRIVIDGSPTELSVALYSSDRKVRRSIGCIQGAIQLSEITKEAGEYQVGLKSCDHGADEEYHITLASVRTAADPDGMRVTAERTCEEANRLVHTRPSQPAAALLKYEEAAAMWRTVGDEAEEVKALLSAGNLHRDSGNLARALEYFTRALQLAEAEQMPVNRAAILRAAAMVYLRKEETDQALEYCSQALTISQSHADRNGEAEGLLLLGDIHYRMYELEEANHAAMQAYTIWESLRYKRGEARSLWDLAAIASDRNEFKQAYEHGQHARALYDALDDQLGRAKSSALLGHILSSTGRKQEALDQFEDARAVLIGSGDLTSEAMVLNSIAQTHADLGDYNSALPFAKLAREQYSILGDKEYESYTEWAMGFYYFAVGDLTNARLFLGRALAGSQTTSNSRLEALCWRDLGVVQEALGEASLALSNLTRALEMSRGLMDRRLEASVLLAIGRVREDAGDETEALGLYRESLGLQRATEDRFGELTVLYYIARCQQRVGDIAHSVVTSETAIEIVEKLRSSLASSGLRTFYFASTRQHFELYIDSLMRLRTGRAFDVAKAFELSEMARARTLLDSINETRLSISQGMNEDMLEREASLRVVIDAKSEQYSQLLSVNSSSKELTAIGDELGRLNAEYDELQGQIRIRNPHFAALVQPRPAKLSEIQEQVLDNDTMLLEYALGEENSYLWVLTTDDSASYVLPKRVEIEKKVRQVRELMTARTALTGEKPDEYRARVGRAEVQYPQAATELAQMLLGPVADRLGKRRLVIVADGALQYLPLGALPPPITPLNSSFTPLVVEHEIVSLPSASTLMVIRREAPLRGNPDRTVAVFADPVFQDSDSRVHRSQTRVTPAQSNTTRSARSTVPIISLRQALGAADSAGVKVDLPRLPATKQEAEAILAMVPPDLRMAALGFNATKAAAMNPDLKRYRIVHFATHTILSDDHPDLSSLVLSLVNEKGYPQSGFLRLRDMYNLHLAAELVVLSACDTALGKEIKGEGLMSMVRGFMYSGTPRVLASLWKVDDDATAELMKEFYKQLLQVGLTPAAALRQAQIAQMQKKSRQSPYYWAGFQLQGEWK
jgi:CHAT domain-containing protein